MEELERDGRLLYSSNGVPRLKRYVDDTPGVVLQDIWTDINRLDAHSDERVGFETQKPVSLLERIIRASSNPGDIVLDPFAGSGTTLVAAERLKRSWIGSDESLLASSIALSRVRQEVNLDRVALEGFPADTRAALRLRRVEPMAFGMWGTSMLATLASRRSRAANLITGTGRLKIRSKAVQLMSWVPLCAKAEPAMPEVPRGRLAKLGVVLRADRHDALLARAVRDTLDIPIHELELAEIVDVSSRRRGMAAELVKLATAPA
jgi:hypothetical protein